MNDDATIKLIELLEATTKHFDQLYDAELKMVVYYKNDADAYLVPDKDKVHFCDSPACVAGHAVCSPEVRALLPGTLLEGDLTNLANEFHFFSPNNLAANVMKSLCNHGPYSRKSCALRTGLFDFDKEEVPKHLTTNDVTLSDANNYIKLVLKKLKDNQP